MPTSTRPTLRFLGAAGTVTGSKYLISVGEGSFLLDCGMFQGAKALRLRNWDTPPFDCAGLKAVVLSHAHIDHSGYLPLLAKHNFRGKVYCTTGTADLLKVLLLDAAHLQEEEASTANRHGFSKHDPALPLYTVDDATQILSQVVPVPYGQSFTPMDGASVTFRPAGHILGSATVDLRLGNTDPARLVFSGDIGRWDQPLLRDPEFIDGADVLMIESTYGDRIHPPDTADMLGRIVNDAVARGGALIVPAFAVGRIQHVMWLLDQLSKARKIPRVPIYVDSPMGIKVDEIYCAHPEDFNPSLRQLIEGGACPFSADQYRSVRTIQESKELNALAGPFIIIASSGMATGGRVLHHLKHRLPDPKTTVLLVGYQAEGTRGRSLQDKAPFVRIHGQDVPVKATIAEMDGLSAHGDKNDIFRWLKGFRNPPRQTFCVHGETDSADGLARAITTELHWSARPAVDGETVTL